MNQKNLKESSNQLSSDKNIPTSFNVTYVVTVFNKEKYLPEVIEGLKSQVGDFSREYIFVNDGSSDNSVEVITTSSQSMEYVRIIDQKNQGLIQATLTGIREAKGEYIIFCDADDVLLKDSSKLLLEAVQMSGKKAATCSLYIPRSQNYIESFVQDSESIPVRTFTDLRSLNSREAKYDYIISENDYSVSKFSEEINLIGYVFKDAFAYALKKGTYYVGATASLIEAALAKSFIDLNSKARHTQDVLLTSSILAQGYDILCIKGIGSYPLTTMDGANYETKLTANQKQVYEDSIHSLMEVIDRYPSFFNYNKRILNQVILICLRMLWVICRDRGCSRFSKIYFLYKFFPFILKLPGIGFRSHSTKKLIMSLFQQSAGVQLNAT